MFNRQKQEGECYTVYYETKGKNNSCRFFRIPNEKKIEIYECNFNNVTYILYDRWTITVFLKKGRTSFRENPWREGWVKRITIVLPHMIFLI